MTTTMTFTIERRDHQRENWGTFGPGFSTENGARAQMTFYIKRYPEHRFRIVKIIETREVLK